MNVVFTILVVAVIIASVLLTLVILLQNSKGGGLARNFTAGNQTFGVRQTSDILEKITWALVAFIFVASVCASFTSGKGGRSQMDITDEIVNSTEQAAPEFPAAPLPQDAPAEETAPATEE